LAVEAASLALHLRQAAAGRQEADDRNQARVSVPQERLRIVQVYVETDSGRVPADALRRSLHERDVVDLHERVIHGKLTAAFWKGLLEEEVGKKDNRPSVFVLWIRDADLAALARARVRADGVRQIYLSSTLLDGAQPRLPESFRGKTFVTFPFTLPDARMPHAYRARAWLRSRGVVQAYDHLQLNTWFTLAVADHALVNLAGNFSRDYFVESVERETEGTPNPGVFPRLSLGPGQRFASKGSYIVKVSEGGFEAASGWIIP
jgi:hypothetical protein